MWHKGVWWQIYLIFCDVFNWEIQGSRSLDAPADIVLTMLNKHVPIFHEISVTCAISMLKNDRKHITDTLWVHIISAYIYSYTTLTIMASSFGVSQLGGHWKQRFASKLWILCKYINCRMGSLMASLNHPQWMCNPLNCMHSALCNVPFVTSTLSHPGWVTHSCNGKQWFR